MRQPPSALEPNRQTEAQQTPVLRPLEHSQVAPVASSTSELERQLAELKHTMAGLQRSEAYYRHLVEDQSDPICCFSPDFTLTFVNYAYSALYGKQSTEMIGQSILDFIPEAYHASVTAHLASLSAANPVATAENPVRLADGALRWLQWTNRLTTDAAGHAVEYQGVGRDITARRQVEAAEREQRRLAEALRDSLVALTSNLKVDAVMQQILTSAAAVVPSEAASIILFEENGGRIAYCRGFTPEAEAFFKEYRFSLHELVPGGIVAAAQAYLVSDTQTWADWIPLSVSAWIRSSVGVPIAIRGQIIGLLALDSAAPHHFQPTDVEKLQVFAQYASLALENAYQVDRLEQRVVERTAELQAAKEQVEAILHNSPDAILLVHPDLRIKQANAAFTRYFGYQENGGPVGGSQVALSLLDFIHPADAPAVIAMVQAVSHQRAGRQIGIRAQRRGRTFFDVELSVGPVNEAGLVCILRNVTERKQSERALAEERNLLRTMIDAIPDTIYVKDRDHRFVLRNNTPGHSVRGIDPERDMGKTDFDFYPRTLAEAFHAEEQAIFNTGQPLVNHEVQLAREDGRVIWISSTKVPLRNLQGEIIGLAGISHDITARKQTEDALRASEARYRLLADNISDMVTRLNPAGDYLYVSPSSRTILGYDPAEMVGQSAFALIHPDDVVFAQEAIQQARELHEDYPPLRLRFQHKQGHYVWLETSGRTVFAEESGEPIELIVSLRNVTKQKQAEIALQEALQKEKELSELKSRFVSMASHEFRTPLASILVLTETLLTYRHKLTDEQVTQRLGKIQEQVGHLKDIMDDVLQLARLQARRGEFNPAPLDLDALCRTVLEEFRSQSADELRLFYTCNAAIPAVNLDQRLMRQTISNLVANAIKYSSADKAVLVRLIYTDVALLLQVQDEGIGIPAADLKHLFQPFHRASNVGSIPGTGLGLVIAQESVELHGGTITVDSQLGVGTTFTVIIPCQE